jgi:nicotinamide-nucleotide amidase
LQRCQADIALSVTGFAGPAGDDKEEGLVFIGCARRGHETMIEERHFGAVGRGPVRIAALKVLMDLLERAIEQA